MEKARRAHANKSGIQRPLSARARRRAYLRINQKEVENRPRRAVVRRYRSGIGTSTGTSPVLVPVGRYGRAAPTTILCEHDHDESFSHLSLVLAVAQCSQRRGRFCGDHVHNGGTIVGGMHLIQIISALPHDVVDRAPAALASRGYLGSAASTVRAQR